MSVFPIKAMVLKSYFLIGKLTPCPSPGPPMFPLYLLIFWTCYPCGLIWMLGPGPTIHVVSKPPLGTFWDNGQNRFCRSSLMKARFTGLTIIWAKKLFKISWPCALAISCLSHCGTRNISITFRSLWQKPWASVGAGHIMTNRVRCAIWCKTI